MVIGASLSLSGDFSADGQAFERGYKLWASDVNKTGGLMGHPVKLDIVSDASSPAQVVTNYQKLISSDHAKLVFGPFSTLLTVPSSKVVNRYGYAFVEGAGGAPAAFGNGLHNIFDVSLPVVDNLVPFAKWVSTLPARAATQDRRLRDQRRPVHPAADPAGPEHHERGGDQDRLQQGVPGRGDRLRADRQRGGQRATPTRWCSARSTCRRCRRSFTPSSSSTTTRRSFIATAGPDQGADFLKAVGGAANAEGIMYPNGWYPGYANSQSQKMVSEYVAKYGGTPADVNADVAEAYSVGQAVAQAVAATHSLDNAKIISYLHSGVTLNSVQGPVKFDAKGENGAAAAFVFQWQKGNQVQVLPTGASGSKPPTYPKPNWGS